jgi:hypothetical protein
MEQEFLILLTTIHRVVAMSCHALISNDFMNVVRSTAGSTQGDSEFNDDNTGAHTKEILVAIEPPSPQLQQIKYQS